MTIQENRRSDLKKNHTVGVDDHIDPIREKSKIHNKGAKQ